MLIRGVRGATTVEEITPQEVYAKTKELLTYLVKKNGIKKDEVASIFFTVTQDMQVAFPARAVREMGWCAVPLMCAVEIDVPGSLQRCIRVLLHWNTEKDQEAIIHGYLHGAQGLRPDLMEHS